MAELYQARFEGPVPDVKAKDGVVTIRYPRRLLGSGRGATRGGGHAQRRHPVADRDPGWSSGDHRRTGRSRSRRVGGQRGTQHDPAWSFPHPLAWFPYRSAGEHQRSPFDALQASPPESTSRAGSPNLSSTIKPSAMWATTCGCKALALIRLPRTTTSKSPAPPAWSPSPPVDVRRRGTARFRDMEAVHLTLPQIDHMILTASKSEVTNEIQEIWRTYVTT